MRRYALVLPIQLTPTLEILRHALLRDDVQTQMRALDVQVGDPAWAWRNALLGYSLESDARERFLSAMRRWQEVQHPGLLSVQQILEQPRPIALLELAHPDCSLAHLLDWLRSTKSSLPRGVALRIASELGVALRAAHHAGIAHGVWADHVLFTPTMLKLAPFDWATAGSIEADVRNAEALCAALVDVSDECEDQSSWLARLRDRIFGTAPEEVTRFAAVWELVDRACNHDIRWEPA